MFHFLVVAVNTMYYFLQTRGLHEVLHWLHDFISTGWTAESWIRLLPEPHQCTEPGQGVWSHGTTAAHFGKCHMAITSVRF